MTEDKKPKSGMYGETPRITIGRYTICMCTDEPNEDRIWVENEEGEGGVFTAVDFEQVIEDRYNELF